jgi:hypothetical protein
MNEPQTAARPSRTKPLIWGGAALLAAAAIVLVFVLPAEFGKDPTGLGRALGLDVLSTEGMNEEQIRGAEREGVLAELPGGQVANPQDRYTIELAPFESTEFKYTLKEGEQMRFAWTATGPIDFDMHAHPFEGGEELTESYAITKSPSQSGVYTAPFTGIHGWYWQNRTMDNVTLTLDASGAMTTSTIFDQFGDHPRELAPPAEGAAESETRP